MTKFDDWTFVGIYLGRSDAVRKEGWFGLRQVLWGAMLGLLVTIALAMPSQPAMAANIDPYVRRYLRIYEPVEVVSNADGKTQTFSPQAISEGKRLFEDSCKTCHVGGATLPNPTISLSLKDLQGATPSRANVAALVTYFRRPMSYDGKEEEIFCRQVPESWLNESQVQNLAAFILKAAEVAPGWGSETF